MSSHRISQQELARKRRVALQRQRETALAQMGLPSSASTGVQSGREGFAGHSLPPSARILAPAFPITAGTNAPNPPVTAAETAHQAQFSNVWATQDQMTPEFVFKKHRKERIVIDSKDRDTDKNGVPLGSHGAFRYTLGDNFRNVVSIKLVGAVIPNTDYNINDDNNQFVFYEDATPHLITLPVGDYEAATLEVEMAAAINAVAAGTYTVTVDVDASGATRDTGLLTLEHSSGPTPASFSLNFDEASFIAAGGVYEDDSAPVLGFETGKIYTDTALSLTSPNKINLFGTRYVTLVLNSNNQQLGNVRSKNANIQEGFGMIYMDIPFNNIKYLREGEEGIVQYYERPIPSISLLDIQFLTCWGHPYNFRGHNVALTFEFTMLNADEETLIGLFKKSSKQKACEIKINKRKKERKKKNNLD
jgi:hypothetical protein